MSWQYCNQNGCCHSGGTCDHQCHHLGELFSILSSTAVIKTNKSSLQRKIRKCKENANLHITACSKLEKESQGNSPLHSQYAEKKPDFYQRLPVRRKKNIHRQDKPLTTQEDYSQTFSLRTHWLEKNTHSLKENEGSAFALGGINRIKILIFLPFCRKGMLKKKLDIRSRVGHFPLGTVQQPNIQFEVDHSYPHIYFKFNEQFQLQKDSKIEDEVKALKIHCFKKHIMQFCLEYFALKFSK